jgi:hypothetical protein
VKNRRLKANASENDFFDRKISVNPREKRKKKLFTIFKMATSEAKKSAKNEVHSSVEPFRLPPPKPLMVVEEKMDKKWNKWHKNFK